MTEKSRASEGTAQGTTWGLVELLKQRIGDDEGWSVEVSQNLRNGARVSRFGGGWRHRAVLAERERDELEDCGQDGVCRLSPGCNRHWEERNRELVRENEVLRSNSDHLSSENASLARQVESMAMRIESLAEELAKPEDVREEL